MAHLLALTLARALALVVGFGSFALYMAAFFFPEVHRKHDLTWSGIGLLYAVVLWFCAGQLEGALLLGQLSGVALLAWLGWQVLTLRRIKTPIQQQTLPGASSQELTQVALGQAKAAADNFSLAETATAIAGVTSSAIAAARGQAPASRSAPQACPIDTSPINTSAAQPSKPAVKQPAVSSVVTPVRSQPERQQTSPSARVNASPAAQPESEPAARSSQSALYVTDEEILQPILSPMDSTTAATSPAVPVAEAEATAAVTDDDWGNWLEDEDLEESTAATVTLASASTDTVAQSFDQTSLSTADRSALGIDRTDQPFTPVGQSAQPQSQNQSKLGGLAGWVGALLPFGRKKKSQPMVTLPTRESSLPRSSQAPQFTPIQSSQPMLTIPRRESSLRRPSASTPSSSTTVLSTADPGSGASAIAADVPQASLPDHDPNLDSSAAAVADTIAAQSPEPSPEEILIPEALPSDEEAWGRMSAIANPEDEALTEAVLIEEAAMTKEPDEPVNELDHESDPEPVSEGCGAEDEVEKAIEKSEEPESSWNPSPEPAVDGQVAGDATGETTAEVDEAATAIAEAQPAAVSLADTDLTITPASASAEVPEAFDVNDDAESSDDAPEAPEATDVDDTELAEATETELLTQADELDHEKTHDNEQVADTQASETNPDSQETDLLDSPVAIDEPELPPATDHPALKRPNPPSPELLDELQRQHYTDAGRE